MAKWIDYIMYKYIDAAQEKILNTGAVAKFYRIYNPYNLTHLTLN